MWCSLTRGGCLREIPTIVLWMEIKNCFFCIFDHLWEVWFCLREIPTSSHFDWESWVWLLCLCRRICEVVNIGSTVSLPRYDSVFNSNPLCCIAGPRVILIKWEHGMTAEQSKKLWIYWFWRSFSRRSVPLVWQVWTNCSPSWSSRNCRFVYLSFLFCFGLFCCSCFVFRPFQGQ